MAKVSRNQLKSIVKECLLEILSEGFSSSESGREFISEARTETVVRKPRRRRLPQPSSRDIENNVNESVKMLTDDPMMAQIFSDTAKTTLQDQISAESAGPMAISGDAAARTASVSDPMDLFGGSADNWAALAFSDTRESK